MCTCGFQSRLPLRESSSLLQDLGCAGLSLHVVVQENMCRVTWHHEGFQGGTLPKRVTSPYILQKSRSLQLSIPGHSSALSISHKPGWLGRSCISISSAAIFSSQTSQQTSSLTVRPHGRPSSLSLSPPSFKCSAQNFLCDLISSPSYGVVVSTIFASSSVFFTLFWLPSLVGAKVSSDRQVSGHPGWASAPCLLHRCSVNPHSLMFSQSHT